MTLRRYCADSQGMYLSNDRHEAHEAPCWAPQEILHPVAQRPFGLAVDDAGTDLHGVDVSQQGFQQHLGTIQLRAPVWSKNPPEPIPRSKPPRKQPPPPTQRRQPQHPVNTTRAPCRQPGRTESVPAGVSDFLTMRAWGGSDCELTKIITSLKQGFILISIGIYKRPLDSRQSSIGSSVISDF